MSSILNFVNSHFQNIWIKFALSLAATFILAFIAKLIMRRILKPLALKTKTKIDDLIIKSVSSLIFSIVILIGIKISLGVFQLQTTYHTTLVNSVLIVVITILAIRMINNFAHQWMRDWKYKTKTTADDRLIPILQKILIAVTIVLAVFFILDSWDVNLSPLLMTAGISGIAIGLAVKEPLENILGGLQLVLDKAFKVGDKIKLESGELGLVLDIGLRSTKLKTYDNEIIYIPNGYLANAKIKNYTQPDFKLRVNVYFGVEYGTDTARVPEAILPALRTIDKVIEDPAPAVHFLKMADFSLDFVARVWVDNFADAYDTEILVTGIIYKTLNEVGIGIPFPTRTVYTKSLD